MATKRKATKDETTTDRLNSLERRLWEAHELKAVAEELQKANKDEGDANLVGLAETLVIAAYRSIGTPACVGRDNETLTKWGIRCANPVDFATATYAIGCTIGIQTGVHIQVTTDGVFFIDLTEVMPVKMFNAWCGDCIRWRDDCIRASGREGLVGK